MNHTILIGDVQTRLAELADKSVRTCITSPPYWGLRDYGVEGQLGLETTPEEYVNKLVAVFRQVKRILTDDGTLWLNLGDSYFPHNGTRGNTKAEGGDTLRGRDNKYQPAPRLETGSLPIKQKDLVGIPWRVAFALQADGWYLRQDIIWAKPNPMPESVRDRCTKAHEYLFLLSKSPRYFFDNEAIKVPAAESTKGRGPVSFGGAKGRAYDPAPNDPNFRQGNHQWGRTYEYTDGLVNKRDVWTIATKPFKGAHFAVMPEALVEPCVLAGSQPGDLVLDPFAGSGTVGVVARKHGRSFIGVELNPEYAALAQDRIGGVA